MRTYSSREEEDQARKICLGLHLEMMEALILLCSRHPDRFKKEHWGFSPKEVFMKALVT